MNKRDLDYIDSESNEELINLMSNDYNYIIFNHTEIKSNNIKPTIWFFYKLNDFFIAEIDASS